MHHRLLFISSHYNLGLYFKSQLVKSAIYPLTPTTAILKVLLSKGLHKASHLPSLTILMHLRYCSQVHLSDSMTLITKLPDSVIQWYSQCLQNKVQKSLEVLMEENKLLAHLPNVLQNSALCKHNPFLLTPRSSFHLEYPPFVSMH